MSPVFGSSSQPLDFCPSDGAFREENCDVNAELLDALPFLRHLEEPDFELPENFRPKKLDSSYRKVFKG